ncbi:nicotinate-nucleotide diphosphorylase, partial [Gemmatimonadota bacterium]
MIDAEMLNRLIQIALEEDVGSGDVTSDLTLDPRSESDGIILAREEGVMAGMPVVDQVFFQVDPNVTVTSRTGEGDVFSSGGIVAEITGPTRSILVGERLALNFLQRLCGVATKTRTFVDAVAGTGATILDTRKTTPG